jgi:ABC-type transport system involved in multi-copper enzyme maturation permease subunit
VKGAVWAIWTDTWRQSRHQKVYILLVCVLLVVALGAVFLVKVRPSQTGEAVLTMRWEDRPTGGLETAWNKQYRQAVMGGGDEAELQRARANASQARIEQKRLQLEVGGRISQAMPAAERTALSQRLEQARVRADEAGAELARIERRLSTEAQRSADERSVGLSPLEKGVEVWCSRVTLVLLWVVMVGFISTAAGYFPGLMMAGAVDLVLAKPIHRSQLFIGKFLGGLGLSAAALLACDLVLVAGLGLSTGVWHWSVLASLPLTLFSLGLLFALITLLGIVTRSATIALLGGYAYYLIVDTALLGVQAAQSAGLKTRWLDTVAWISRYALPGFSGLRNAAAAAVMHIPSFEWQPVLVATLWLLALLSAGYGLFRRLDF